MAITPDKAPRLRIWLFHCSCSGHNNRMHRLIDFCVYVRSSKRFRLCNTKRQLPIICGASKCCMQTLRMAQSACIYYISWRVIFCRLFCICRNGEIVFFGSLWLEYIAGVGEHVLSARRDNVVDNNWKKATTALRYICIFLELTIYFANVKCGFCLFIRIQRLSCHGTFWTFEQISVSHELRSICFDEVMRFQCASFYHVLGRCKILFDSAAETSFVE